MGEKEKCEWHLDDATDSCLWETSCGQAFQFSDGGPEDNHFKYCYKCGKEIEPVRISETDECDPPVARSECCDALVIWAADGPICNECGRWAVTKPHSNV